MKQKIDNCKMACNDTHNNQTKRQDKMSTFRFENKSTGKSWMSRIVKQGDRYGLNNCLIHDKPSSMVEFYDTNNGEQFVSRYYVDTFLGIGDGVGLMLDGGCSAWNLDGESVDSVKDWLKNN